MITYRSQQQTASVLTTARKWILLAAGLLSVALGLIGLFLPLLPTVPFLLLAAFCFARSSNRLHRWLLSHRHLGPLVAGYLDGAGVPVRAKATAIALIWVTVPLSAFLLVPHRWMRVLILAVAFAVTIYLLRLPTASSSDYAD
jgi:uncharacterized membrane protein YbaN (DUF454 family)